MASDRFLVALKKAILVAAPALSEAQTVKELIETETVRMVYRSINHEAPEYLTGLFQRYLKPVLDSFVTPALTFMYLFYKLHVAKNASRIEELNFGMI